MSTAILKAEVQARIDALTYPIDATVLLQNAVDTVGLGLDLTNIISVLNSSTAAIDTNTPNDDVTALNAASIALGVTSKGGGSGGVEIGGTSMRVSSDIDITDSNGHRYLRSGYVETDLTDIDSSLYQDGLVFEDYGTVDSLSANYDPVVSATGVIIYLTGSSLIYRQEDKDTPAVSQLSVIGGGKIECLATDGAGKWVIGGAGTTKYSVDDGLTWNTTAGGGRDYIYRVGYNSSTGKWVGLQGSTSSSSYTGYPVYSDDGITWQESTVGVNPHATGIYGPTQQHEETNIWAYSSIVSGSIKQIYISKDDGLTWKKGNIDNILSTLFTLNDSVFGIQSNKIYEYKMNSSNTSVELVNTVSYNNEYTNTYITTGMGTPFYYKGLFYCKNGLVSADGVNFDRLVGSDEIEFTYYDFFHTDGVRLFVKNTTVKEPVQVSVPAAGSGVVYTEGSAHQYIRIK